MLVFVDESGDSGFKTEQGSSQFFTVALVIFEEHDEATACDQRIQLLRRELGWNERSEFHFNRNSDRVRRTFLQAVSPYNFFYYGIVLNKDPQKLWGEGFRHKPSFYKYTCSLVFENAKEKLNRAHVIIDKSGNLDFRRQLAKYLTGKINEEHRKIITQVKMQRSESNNLLQLTDYIAGVINRSVQRDKKFSADYRRIIAHREMYVQIWPR
ncbi:MAG: DUF3800 domain-containing protein [Nitrospirae bacterium]|nr:DUF3800 domain-containing protein [Nitrospirota bacterium]